MLIAACAGLVIVGLLGSVALSTSATTLPLTGTVYVEGVVGTPQQLNPLAQGPDASPAERDLAALLLEGLTRVGMDGRIEPALAERWTVSQDGLVYTFTLRAGQSWHDGAPVTADDVLYTVRGVQNANFPGDPALAALWRNVLVQKQDERTVQFQLSAPFAPFPSVARLPILPAHLFHTLRPEQWPTAPWSRHPVGSGRYKLYALDAQQAVLVPFANYPGAPALDNLVLRFYPTAEAAVLGLSRREVQGVANVATGGQSLSEVPRRAQRLVAPVGSYTMLAFNLQQSPLDELPLRRALVLGLNREALITNVLGGQGQALDTPVLPGTWAAESAARLPAFKRSSAQQQLGALGYVDTNGDGWVEADGQRLVLPLLIADAVEANAVAAELAQQLREIGIALDIRRMPSGELQNALASHNFTMALHSWSDVGADPDVYALWHSSRADGGANYAGLRDLRIDQLLVDGRAAQDEPTRRRIYADFQRRWVELIPSLPLYQSVLAYDVEGAPAPPAPPDVLSNRADRFAVLDEWLQPNP